MSFIVIMCMLNLGRKLGGGGGARAPVPHARYKPAHLVNKDISLVEKTMPVVSAVCLLVCTSPAWYRLPLSLLAPAVACLVAA